MLQACSFCVLTCEIKSACCPCPCNFFSPESGRDNHWENGCQKLS